jgi:hypothetical protein
MAMSFRRKAENSSRQVSEDDSSVKALQVLLEKYADADSVAEKNESVLTIDYEEKNKEHCLVAKIRSFDFITFIFIYLFIMILLC